MDMQTQLDIDVTWLIEAHLAEVVAIEAASFDHPWTAKDFRDWRRATRNAVGLVALSQERIVGFILVEMEHRRIVIHNIAVTPWARRAGVATRFIRHLVNGYVTPKRQEILVAIRESNLDAQLWAKAAGFLAHTVEREYYSDGQAAYVFSWWLDE